MTTEIDFICTHCKHRTPDFTCPAFPYGIQLRPGVLPLLHDDILPNQVGDTTYESDGTPEAVESYKILARINALHSP